MSRVSGGERAAVAGRARVVLVEDDPAIRGFVAVALEDLGLDLVECGTVAAAIAALRRAPADLVITDLMLPDDTGLGLLQRMSAEPALRGGARVVVFSASIGPGLDADLASHGVWRVLRKPAPVPVLQACVRDALAAALPAAQASEEGGSEASTAGLVERHFGGDAELLARFQAVCRSQFPADIDAGDRACAQADVQAFRRVLHNLKTVLQMLGEERAADLAARAEATLVRVSQTAAAQELWQQLRSDLMRLTVALG